MACAADVECPVLYPCLQYLHGLNTRAKLYALWEHKHGQPPMVTVTSLYRSISYIYAYSYNFYDLSSLHAYCMSISFGTFSMSLAIFYLYFSFFYTFLVSILCIFHIHSITYYSMSLVYLLSILLLYSCVSHILCLILVICLYLILDLFHIISCIMSFASFLYFHVHFLSCSSIVHVS